MKFKYLCSMSADVIRATEMNIGKVIDGAKVCGWEIGTYTTPTMTVPCIAVLLECDDECTINNYEKEFGGPIIRC